MTESDRSDLRYYVLGMAESQDIHAVTAAFEHDDTLVAVVPDGGLVERVLDLDDDETISWCAPTDVNDPATSFRPACSRSWSLTITREISVSTRRLERDAKLLIEYSKMHPVWLGAAIEALAWDALLAGDTTEYGVARDDLPFFSSDRPSRPNLFVRAMPPSRHTLMPIVVESGYRRMPRVHLYVGAANEHTARSVVESDVFRGRVTYSVVPYLRDARSYDWFVHFPDAGKPMSYAQVGRRVDYKADDDAHIWYVRDDVALAYRDWQSMVMVRGFDYRGYA